jgi:hypothetical protein
VQDFADSVMQRKKHTRSDAVEAMEDVRSTDAPQLPPPPSTQQQTDQHCSAASPGELPGPAPAAAGCPAAPVNPT